MTCPSNDKQALEGAAEFFEQIATNADPAPLAFAQAIRRALRSSVKTEDAILPCDVILPPATTIRAGAKLSTLIEALNVRGMAAIEAPSAEGEVRQRFAQWQNDGLALATEAGCEVSITVKSALSTWTLTNFDPPLPAAASEVTEHTIKLTDQDRQLLRMIVPSIDSRSREPGDAWNNAAALIWLLIDTTDPITAALKGDRS